MRKDLDVLLAAVQMSAEWYDNHIIEQTDDSVVFHSHSCPMWQAARDLAPHGLTEDAFCHPHEVYYQDWLDDLGSDLGFKFTKSLARGDTHCEWVVKPVAPSPATNHQQHDA
jgi:hypothetical protein